MAIGQRDIKRLVSYTSVAHFGFIALGVFALTSQGGAGAVLYMVNHGLSTGALFIVVGILATSARQEPATSAPSAAWRRWRRCSAACLPGGRVCPSLALPGPQQLRQRSSSCWSAPSPATGWPAVVATTGIILAALYVLLLYQRTMQGTVSSKVQAFKDLSPRELLAVGPLIVLIVALGVYPKPMIDMINPAVKATLSDVHKSDPIPVNAQIGGRK